SLQSAQERAAHCGIDVGFGKRPKCCGEDEHVSAGKPDRYRTPGAVWTYCRHINGESRNVDAVPAVATSDVVALPSEQRTTWSCSRLIQAVSGSDWNFRTALPFRSWVLG